MRSLLAVSSSFTPLRASRRALAKPMPDSLPAPLTRATWPAQADSFVTSFMGIFLICDHRIRYRADYQAVDPLY